MRSVKGSCKGYRKETWSVTAGAGKPSQGGKGAPRGVLGHSPGPPTQPWSPASGMSQSRMHLQKEET